MTRYEYLYRIAEILVPEQTEEFYDYLLHSCDDDGGFLRTRYCYRETPLPDSDCDHHVNCALITLRRRYDFNNLPAFYTSDGGTAIKLQIHFGEYQDEEAFYMESEWASSVGFSYPVKINMNKGTYTVSEFKYEKNRHYKIGHPKYFLGDSVRFHLMISGGNYKIKDGVICVVDAFGTVEQQEEPSYDIEIIENGNSCLCKHIRESEVCFRHGCKKLKDYI